jgi:hypothetical protein
MSAVTPAYVVLRLEEGVDPDKVSPGRTFTSRDQADGECERLRADAVPGTSFCVKETYFFSPSAVPRPTSN